MTTEEKVRREMELINCERWTRKPISFREVLTCIHYEDFGDVFNRLPVYDAIKLWGPNFRALSLDFKNKTPDLFLYVDGKDRVYVIYTSGYNYARYAAEVVMGWTHDEVNDLRARI